MPTMKNPKTVYLKDYQSPLFLIDAVDLTIDILEDVTTVHSHLSIRKNPEAQQASNDLVLDGESVELISVYRDSIELKENSYKKEEETLTILNNPAEFSLEITCKIKPQKNTSLEGLYKVDGIFLTQCEAEGFRKITYFPDRPDVMSRYQCTIKADKKKYPVLLANGDLTKCGDLENGRHFATWVDPYPKPSYLFAMVAGDLACREDDYTTKSGRKVLLQIFTEHENIDECDYALLSLQKSMKWDEDVFGLEYDLDTYMIVVTSSFNSGAMENKGLNIFNARFVLAKPETATDYDFRNIEAVIAHEYFHNWTGNRVTLNNWFQLSLKEGLTEFRNQEFSSDMGSRAIQRISFVQLLKATQFTEDAGPMAHPVRPEFYIEVDNFFTKTVYDKGAEIVRMIQVLLGKENFRKGMDLYFKRFDGQAVTIEDFVKAMEDASGNDLSRFRFWYSQAGTPEMTVERCYDKAHQTYSLTCTQVIPDTPGQTNKKPVPIPINLALYGKRGQEIILNLKGKDCDSRTKEMVINFSNAKEIFTFTDIHEEPVPSILRGFSAPVNLNIEYSIDEMIFLMANDNDPFNRWNITRKLLSDTVLSLVEDIQQNRMLEVDYQIIEAFQKALLNPNINKELTALALTVPSESELGDLVSIIDVDAIHTAREFLMNTIANQLKDNFREIFETNQENGPYQIDQGSIAKRCIKNLALTYLSHIKSSDHKTDSFVFDVFKSTNNMTDEIAALSVLTNIESEWRQKAINMFYDKWQNDALVLDKWFAVQAGSSLPDTLENVRKLMDHPKFSLQLTNKVYAFFINFFQLNPWNFHRIDGKGYELLSEFVIKLDRINPRLAARGASYFNQWKKYDKARQEMMQEHLNRILKIKDLSKGTFEIVTKALI
jgi:aminopeptidase N